MKHSGHLSKEGVCSYERTTGAQLKQVSNILSDITNASSSQMTIKPVRKWAQHLPLMSRMLTSLFKCIPEESLMEEPLKPAVANPADLLNGFKLVTGYVKPGIWESARNNYY